MATRSVVTDSQSHSPHAHTEQEELHELAEAYCHRSLLKSATGSEGSLPSHSNLYELVQVHMLLRHGDRSQATDLRMKPPVRFECGMVDRDEQWRELENFKLLPHPKTANVRHLHDPLFRGFESQSCHSGQLTLVGLQQHRQIGLFMKDRYQELLQSVEDTRDIFVQSTDYTRTIDSAAAFLLGFNSKQPQHMSIPIHVSRDINLSSPPPRLTKNYPKCKKLGAIWQRELAKQPRDNRDVHTFHQLAKIGRAHV